MDPSLVTLPNRPRLSQAAAHDILGRIPPNVTVSIARTRWRCGVVLETSDHTGAGFVVCDGSSDTVDIGAPQCNASVELDAQHG